MSSLSDVAWSFSVSSLQVKGLLKQVAAASAASFPNLPRFHPNLVTAMPLPAIQKKKKAEEGVKGDEERGTE